MEKELLNIGCGDRFHKDWENIDLVPFSADVKKIDILGRLPYRDQSFQAVYCSHMLEHLDRDAAAAFAREVFRILKKNGIFRVLVPDLEQMARLYLEKLAELKNGNRTVEQDYDWIMLEMFDQMVRQKSGGHMWYFLVAKNTVNKDFIRARIGLEAEKIWNYTPLPQNKAQKKSPFPGKKLKLVKWLVKRIMGKNYLNYFEEGIFRNSGEIHRWMYDSFSLTRLLKQAGFEIINMCQANQSTIPDFAGYGLEIINGNTAKPDSLFIETVKPVL
ncbi:MAG TPA: methyltransferase domain-containing protein [Candidatus Kapabacteria bacterium]|nr:methyltransferase domain-containing protein [Candidatus Kapabacteria bacterium]